MLKRENVWIAKEPVPFIDRQAAGERLADRVVSFLERQPADQMNDLVVLGVPRAGMRVAEPVAKRLGLPLDLVVTRKLRAPHQPDLVVGAVTERGRVFLNKPVIDALAVSERDLQAQIEKEKVEISASVASYRSIVPAVDLAGKTAVLVDDNVITGSTMFATLRGLWAERPRNIILAVPVAPRDTLMSLSNFADYVIALHAPANFTRMSNYYQDHSEATEEDVLELLRQFSVTPSVS